MIKTIKQGRSLKLRQISDKLMCLPASSTLTISTAGDQSMPNYTGLYSQRRARKTKACHPRQRHHNPDLPPRECSAHWNEIHGNIIRYIIFRLLLALPFEYEHGLCATICY
jgi:hypothetical protein